jgi:hypothetical protein
MFTSRSRLYCCLVLGASLLEGCQTPTSALTTTVVNKPSAVATPTASDGPPVLTSVDFRHDVLNARGVPVSVVPDFHFVAPKGNVIVLRRELVSTTGSTSQLRINPTESVDIAPDVQRKGATISGGWQCGTAQYQVTIRAFLMDADGVRSNSKEYTLHCNGG